MAETPRVSFVRDVIKPTSRQREYLAALETHRYILYGGAAGGGKSYLLRWALVWLLLQWAGRGLRGVKVGLFCEDYPALKDRHLSRVRAEFPAWLGQMHEGDREFRLLPRWGGGVLAFRNLADPSAYLSSEWAAIAVDELTRNPKETFDFLRMRLRWSGIEDTKFLAATNPGGPGHAWVKALWIDKMFPPEMDHIRGDFAFVRALPTDNPHLHQSYFEGLASLPDALRRAYLLGEWDVFAGQVFTEWSRDTHVVAPFAIPPDWPRFRALDWGFARPYSVGWYAVDYDGVIYRYRELYGCRSGEPNVGTQETARDVAKRIRELEAGERISYGVADPACWQRTGHDGPTIQEAFAREGVHWQQADNDRAQGKMQVHQRLRGFGAGLPGLKIFDSCVHLIRTLPALCYSQRNPEDVDTDGEDHAYDEMRYALMSRPWKPVKKEERKRDAWAVQEKEQSWMGA